MNILVATLPILTVSGTFGIGMVECLVKWALFFQMIDLLKELTRRKVWLFGGIYLGLGWIMLQVAMAVEVTMKLPDWIDQSVLVLLVIGFPFSLLLAWAQESQGKSPPEPNTESAIDTNGEKALPGFSVAVLPFDDLSRDGAFQEISDGVPEDIITRLAGFPKLTVMARNSSFVYKGESHDIRKVGQELGVRFVLEGSFRKTGDKLRMTAQLIEAETGAHAWSNNFDHNLSEDDGRLDALVEDVAQNALSAIASAEFKRLSAMDRADLTAMDLFFLADEGLWQWNLKNLKTAQSLLDEALQQDASMPVAHAFMARIKAMLPSYGSGETQRHWQEAVTHMQRVRAPSANLSFESLVNLLYAALYMGRQSEAQFYAGQMRDQTQWFPETWSAQAWCHIQAGSWEKALEAIETGRSVFQKAETRQSGYLSVEGTAWLGLGDLAKAETYAREAVLVYVNEYSQRLLTAVLGLQGKQDEAARELEALKAFRPQGLTVQSIQERLTLQSQNETLIDLLLEGLRRAGLEEGVSDD